MPTKQKNTKKPLIGFFPLFYNLAETGRAVLVAKRYLEQGGSAVFFSHGGKYEYLAHDIGCKVIPVNPIYSNEFIDDLWKYSRLEKRGAPFNKSVLREHVEAEATAYKDAGVEWVVSTNNFPCSLSTRYADIPFVSITPRFSGHFRYYPEDAEFLFTSLIPEWIKVRVLNWQFQRSKTWVRPFNALAREYGLPRFTYPQQITHGDYTFFTDFLELANVYPSDMHDNEFYIGPIFFDELFNHSVAEEQKVAAEIKSHISRGEKSILVSLGSSGTPELFTGILDALGSTEYRVVAVYTSVLSQNTVPQCSENILLKQHVPSLLEVNKQVDFAVLHGGQGTIYTAAYAGKPVLGFPMQFEQHMNLELLEQKGLAEIASRKRFSKENFLSDISTMFSQYDTYFENAQRLAASLPPPQGDSNACKILLDVIQRSHR